MTTLRFDVLATVQGRSAAACASPSHGERETQGGTERPADETSYFALVRAELLLPPQQQQRKRRRAAPPPPQFGEARPVQSLAVQRALSR